MGLSRENIEQWFEAHNVPRYSRSAIRDLAIFGLAVSALPPDKWESFNTEQEKFNAGFIKGFTGDCTPSIPPQSDDGLKDILVALTNPFSDSEKVDRALHLVRHALASTPSAIVEKRYGFEKAHAVCILLCRDALIRKDYEAAYHWLYTLNSKQVPHDPFKPWADLEALAGPDYNKNRADGGAK